MPTLGYPLSACGLPAFTLSARYINHWLLLGTVDMHAYSLMFYRKGASFLVSVLCFHLLYSFLRLPGFLCPLQASPSAIYNRLSGASFFQFLSALNLSSSGVYEQFFFARFCMRVNRFFDAIQALSDLHELFPKCPMIVAQARV